MDPEISKRSHYWATMKLPTQVETSSPEDGVAQSGSQTAPQNSDHDVHKSSVTAKEDNGPDNFASDNESPRPRGGLPTGAKSEILPGTIEPEDSPATFSKEAQDALDKLYDYLQKYVSGELEESYTSRGMIGTAYSVMRRKEEQAPLKMRIKQKEIFSFMFQAYFRLMEDR